LQGMKESWGTLERWYQAIEGNMARDLKREFLSALTDDLNTPQAIAELHQASPREIAGGLALHGFSLQKEKIAARTTVEAAEIEAAIAARNAARKAKDFKESDRIRDALAAKGILLKDGPSGTTWEVKR
ncbi:MAG TPA: DALR domain-containing protein, partial [Rhizomicrobium sp.]|nr:DALR domain-containing protein [Rhizomicrobium sp.]